VAEPFFPKKVINLVEVAGVHQVMIEVRVAEMSRGLLRRLGFNLNASNNGGKNFGVSLLNNLTGGTAGGSTSGISEKINAVIGFLSHGASWTFFIDALKEEGLLKVLAEPTLITLSGKQANFLAGGEFPVPVPQSSGAGGQTITIEYKSFGVALNFTPTVLSNKKINMHIAPEVSQLDFSNAVTIGGFTIPALTTRRVSTVVELADGQSFAIAGIIQDDVRQVVSKFPILGDVPVLGALFRSSSFQKNESELVIIATPHLVKPVDMAKQTMPTDQYVEPDDVEFYLYGQREGKGQPSIPPSPAEKRQPVEGEDFGHVKPKEGQR
jgi:pilus assembly protein CpaC